MSKISVALCTYNGGKFLSSQLESILSQSQMPDEIVVCDDCSQDNTREILKQFKETSPISIRLYFNDTNLGSTRNFEKAISLCKGDIIFLSDQDDIWLPKKIQLMGEKFTEQPEVGLIFTDADLVDEEGRSLNQRLWELSFPTEIQQRFRKEHISDTLLHEGIVTGATMAFRTIFRKDFLPIPDFDLFIHDGWISFIVSLQANILPLENTLIKYRQHSHQQVGIRNMAKERENITLKKIFNPQEGRLKNNSRYKSYDLTIERQISVKNDFNKLRNILESKNILENNSAKTIIESSIKNKIEILENIISHYKLRRDLPNGKLNRFSPIVKELLKGNYHKFSKGFYSATLDLFETNS